MALEEKTIREISVSGALDVVLWNEFWNIFVLYDIFLIHAMESVL